MIPFDGNRKAVAFLRVSSRRQQDNTSHETQESEIVAYCQRHDLDLARVVRMVESAKDSSQRVQYREGLAWALKNRVKHVVFYVFDRETRNLTDNESNEKLVRAGKIILHYVKDAKVFHTGSSDSDFFLRDCQAVNNKQFIRLLASKIADAQRQKAEDGWFPASRPPLGYQHHRPGAATGRRSQVPSIIVPDSNSKRVALVRREFELRAQGLACSQIRERVLEEGLVELHAIPSYQRGQIEKRLRNPFYYGEFDWEGVRYRGKHELIIDRRILDAVRASFDVGRWSRREGDGVHGLLAGGFLTCASQGCGCNIIYDPKVKTSGGNERTYHYYHCTNGKRVHPTLSGMHASEESLWSQFGQAVAAITLTEARARAAAEMLNQTHRQMKAAKKREMESYRASLTALEGEEDLAYQDLRRGVLDDQMYKRRLAKIRSERARLTALLEEGNDEIDGSYLVTAQSILELATEAKSLWESRPPQERLDFLKTILSNQVLDGVTVRYELKKPFAAVAKLGGEGDWCARRDSNPQAVRHTPLKRTCIPIPPLARGRGINSSDVGGQVNPRAGPNAEKLKDAPDLRKIAKAH